MKSQSRKVDLPKIVTEDQILQIAARENDIEDENEIVSIDVSKISLSETVNVPSAVLQ